MKHNPALDESKCIGCGSCVKDCVANHIVLNEGKVSFTAGNCIGCGHCEAICPTHAMTVDGFEEEPVEISEQTRLDPETLLKAIQTRRSIRQFKNQPVPEEVLKMILEAGRLAPTGGNSMSNGFIVVKDCLLEAEEAAVKLFRGGFNVVKNFSKSYRSMNVDDHFFFKGAPCAIVVTGNNVNGSLAAENMAFMAEAYGLGVLYSGFFTMACEMSGKVKELLKIESDEKMVTTLVLGYPAVKYHRTVRREKGRIRRV